MPLKRKSGMMCMIQLRTKVYTFYRKPLNELSGFFYEQEGKVDICI